MYIQTPVDKYSTSFEKLSNNLSTPIARNLDQNKAAKVTNDSTYVNDFHSVFND